MVEVISNHVGVAETDVEVINTERVSPSRIPISSAKKCPAGKDAARGSEFLAYESMRRWKCIMALLVIVCSMSLGALRAVNDTRRHQGMSGS
jgi:hypothetical protein